ncbi:MAG: hypothetical protein KDC44_20675 [Phaeodactylibacter sp.]|nr:hypothetical protein [Phaeodactylibacter sp.]
MHIRSFLFFCFLIFGAGLSVELVAQDSLFTLVGAPAVKYEGRVNSEGSGVVFFKGKTTEDNNFILSFSPFVDTISGEVLNPDIANPNIYVPANEATEIYLNLQGLSKSGRFAGMLTLSLGSLPSSPHTKVPVELWLMQPSDVTVTLPSANPFRATRGLFGTTWLSDLILPVNFNHEQINFSVENGSAYSLNITNVELDIHGQNSQEMPQLVQWATDRSEAVKPNTDADLSLEILTKSAKPDAYSGNLRVEVEGYDAPFMVPIQIDVKRGVGGAILALLLGLMLSLIVKMLNANKDKTDAYERLVKIWDIVIEQGSEDKFHARYLDLRNKVLLMESPTEVEQIAQAIDQFKTDVLSAGGVKKELAGGEPVRSDVETDPNKPPKKIKGKWIPESWRVRFLVHFAKPILWVFLVTATLLIGINDIYISGGDTFGAGGMWDYLRLIVWGAASEIFSSGITTQQLKDLKTGLFTPQDGSAQ